jgi:hypothetical protein
MPAPTVQGRCCISGWWCSMFKTHGAFRTPTDVYFRHPSHALIVSTTSYCLHRSPAERTLPDDTSQQLRETTSRTRVNSQVANTAGATAIGARDSRSSHSRWFNQRSSMRLNVSSTHSHRLTIQVFCGKRGNGTRARSSNRSRKK